MLGSKKVARPIVDKFDLLCVAVLIISFLLVSRLPAAPSKYGDLYFHDEAKSLAQAARGTGPWSDVSFARAPGPALYYAVPYLFVQSNAPETVYWRAAILWNALWMVVAILLVRRAAELFDGNLAGKIAAVLSLALPFAVYYSFGVAAETPAYVATVIFTYGWALWRKGSGRSPTWAGAIFACAGLFALILCRPNALVVVGIAAGAYVGMRLVKQGSGWDRRFAILGASVGVATVLLVSFTLKHMPGNRGVSTQTSNLDEAVFLSTFQFRTEPWDWRFWGKATRQGSADYLNYVEVQNELARNAEASGTPISRLQLDWTLRDAVTHPWIRVRTMAVRLLSLNVWIVNSARPSAFRLGPFRGEAVYLIFHLLLNAIALIPAVLSVWFLGTHRNMFFAYWPAWGLWMGLLLFHAATYAEPRYMLPAQPGLAVMSACLVAGTIRRKEASTFAQTRSATDISTV